MVEVELPCCWPSCLAALSALFAFEPPEVLLEEESLLLLLLLVFPSLAPFISAAADDRDADKSFEVEEVEVVVVVLVMEFFLMNDAEGWPKALVGSVLAKAESAGSARAAVNIELLVLFKSMGCLCSSCCCCGCETTLAMLDLSSAAG